MPLLYTKKRAVGSGLTKSMQIVTLKTSRKKGNNMKSSTLRSVFIALFAALICAGCFISVPLPGLVPITVQNMFAILSGVLLGNIQGAAAVGIFLVLGSIGVPVFSGMTGGLAIMTGPTGGFLIGYFLGALAAGLIAGIPRVAEKKRTVKTTLRIILATLAGFFCNYLPGIPWFMSVMTSRGKEVDLAFALKACLIPFIPGDTIKIVVTIILAMVLRPTVARYLYPEDATALESEA